jgi:hypothetical protein
MPFFVYYAPVDPDCPTVAKFMHDLFTGAMAPDYEFSIDEFERQHMFCCERCMQYATAHIEVGRSVAE